MDFNFKNQKTLGGINEKNHNFNIAYIISFTTDNEC